MPGALLSSKKLIPDPFENPNTIKAASTRSYEMFENATKNCDEIKGNIVGKMFCKATSGSDSTLEGSETTKEKRGILSKIGWTRPEWTKRKKN